MATAAWRAAPWPRTPRVRPQALAAARRRARRLAAPCRRALTAAKCRAALPAREPAITARATGCASSTSAPRRRVARRAARRSAQCGARTPKARCTQRAFGGCSADVSLCVGVGERAVSALLLQVQPPGCGASAAALPAAAPGEPLLLRCRRARSRCHKPPGRKVSFLPAQRARSAAPLPQAHDNRGAAALTASRITRAPSFATCRAGGGVCGGEAYVHAHAGRTQQTTAPTRWHRAGARRD
jgi:hypothetical protein